MGLDGLILLGIVVEYARAGMLNGGFGVEFWCVWCWVVYGL